MKLATNNENRVYKLFRNILNEASDYETILKNHASSFDLTKIHKINTNLKRLQQRELVKRLEQHQGQGLMETFSVFLRRISLTIIGKSSMSPLIQAVQSFKRTEHGEDKGEFRSRTPEQATAEKLIKYLATSFPSIYRSHIREFIALLKSPDHGLGGFYSNISPVFLVRLIFLFCSFGCIGGYFQVCYLLPRAPGTIKVRIS